MYVVNTEVFQFCKKRKLFIDMEYIFSCRFKTLIWSPVKSNEPLQSQTTKSRVECFIHTHETPPTTQIERLCGFNLTLTLMMHIYTLFILRAPWRARFYYITSYFSTKCHKNEEHGFNRTSVRKSYLNIYTCVRPINNRL